MLTISARLSCRGGGGWSFDTNKGKEIIKSHRADLGKPFIMLPLIGPFKFCIPMEKKIKKNHISLIQRVYGFIAFLKN